jgi:peptidyl-prolyl cis-trans isomerase SurA
MKLIFGWLMVCLAVVTAPGAVAEDLVEQVVAIVDSEPILLSDLQAQLQLALASMQVDPGDTARVAMVMDQLLEQQIEQKVLFREAKARGYEAAEEEILAAVDTAIERNIEELGSKALFEIQLQREGLTEADLRFRYSEQARMEMLSSRLIQTEVRGQVEVTAEDIRRFYEENRDQLPARPPSYHLQHIMMVIRPDSTVEFGALAQAQEVAGKLAASEFTFAEAATRYSDHATGRNGGSLGRVERGDFRDSMGEEFETTMFSLTVGAISEPLRSPLGYHLVTVGEKDSAGNWVKPSHILFGVPRSDDDMQRTYDALLGFKNRVIAGEAFADLAREFSQDLETNADGGELGWLPENLLAPEILEAVTSLPDGGVSDPVRGGDAMHIFHVIARQASGVFEFEEIQEELRGYTENYKLENRYREWLDEIKEQHYIERRDWRR